MSSSDKARIKELEAEISELKRKVYLQAKELKQLNNDRRNTHEFALELTKREGPVFILEKAQEYLRRHRVAIIHCECPIGGKKFTNEEAAKRWCLFTSEGLEAVDHASLYEAWNALVVSEWRIDTSAKV